MEPPPAPPSGGSQRKFRRIVAAIDAEHMDLGCTGAFEAIKSEAEGIARAGVQYCVDDVEKNLKPLLRNYLSGSAAMEHVDKVGHVYTSRNEDFYNGFGKLYEDNPTGTHAVQVAPEVALNVYVKLVEHLKQDKVKAEDGMPTFWLDTAAGKALGPEKKKGKSGGFARLYDSINVPTAEQNKAEQDRCIFAMKPTDFKSIVGTPGTKLLDSVAHELKAIFGFGFGVSPKVVHVLFHWNAHSFFTYHKDEDGDFTAIVNLTYGNSSMHVAGKVEAVYDGIGSTQLFPSKVFHRSGPAPRRCVKVAIFFNKTELISLPDEDEEVSARADIGSKSGAASSSDAAVKTEPSEADADSGDKVKKEPESLPPPRSEA